MNGKPLTWNSTKINAMLMYMRWLSTGVPVGSIVAGRDLGALAGILFRRAVGRNSFNVGAGMARTYIAAASIKGKTPRILNSTDSRVPPTRPADPKPAGSPLAAARG